MRQSSDKLTLKKQTIACLTRKESNDLHAGACTPLETHVTTTGDAKENVVLAAAYYVAKPIPA